MSEALEEAIARIRDAGYFQYRSGCPVHVSDAFIGVLEAAGIRISMDGKGRWVDNVFVERLWRSLKYEEVYLKAYEIGGGGAVEHRQLVPILQSQSQASGSGSADARSGL